ncbi:hypothetical protein ACN28S_18865 [Cystobacter fuscus]
MGAAAWGAGAESVSVVAPHPQGGFVAAGLFGDAVFAEGEASRSRATARMARSSGRAWWPRTTCW